MIHDVSDQDREEGFEDENSEGGEESFEDERSEGREETFEDRLRAAARDLGQSLERAAENLNLDGIADEIESGGERIREFAESAAAWLAEQFGEGAEQASRSTGQTPRGLKRAGPHPLDVPTEDQALALSALASGRWKVRPGTEELTTAEGGEAPDSPAGLVGELRARDWIAASGEVTQLGHDALKRWSERRAG
jgi:hypothetical protein